ncbi:P22 phage major capsid protein family protein [Corynebacterium lubricantis]|uniref:P22 phage major capsid protein family protein n=1 Tax=Corynebacterium lubricantis TaxID=541095 RepID=UPI000376BE3A|nr:P22 phage major capsid protein family protein [Corynebacterium lubricantis]
MAEHLLFTPEQVATSTLAALRNRSTLARIVNQDFSREFVPGRGATVTVKNPIHIDPARVYTKENRANEDEITYSRLVQPYTSISLEDQVYQAVKLPDDFATFTLTDMEREVVAPMAESVADELNATVARAFDSVPEGLTAIDKAPKGQLSNSAGEAITADNRGTGAAGIGLGLQPSAAGSPVRNAMLQADDHSQVLPAIRAARQLLGLRGVPAQNRYLVVGTGWAGALLSTPNLFKVNEAGTDGLLRDATLGRLYGFTIIEDNTIDPYAAYALNRDAVTLVTRVPAVPRGVPFASTASAQGFTLRYLHDYDVNRLQDRAVVDTFAGAEVLDGQRIVKLTAEPGIEEPAAPVTAEPAV